MSKEKSKKHTKATPIEECPPHDSVDAHGIVFRCCRTNPPTSSDMLTAEETGRLPDAPACLRRALSVFRSQEDAEHQLRLFRRWKKNFVGQILLEPSQGKTKMTTGQQPSHTSWWPDMALPPNNRAPLFKIITEVQQ
ncbi:hypothetical protein KAI87_03575 [Myxococcota bacterium]|nr:hypothetical protein [Myxococcota bacterium]